MAIKRDSLRAERDFYAPMTGGTQIRYSEAPIANRDTYSSQVKSRLSEIGQGQRRAAPIISAIKTRMRKTDDPFTQVGQQKTYAPQQEENQIGAQIDAQIGAAASQAEEIISEGVAQAETAVQEFKTKSNRRQQERRLQRQQERQADLKKAKAERQSIRSEMKKLFDRDQKRYGNTVPEGSFGSGSKPGPAVDTNVQRHSVGTSKDQNTVPKGSFGSGSKPGPAVDTNVSRHSVGTSKNQPKRGVGQGSSAAVLGRTTRRQGEKPTGPAVKLTNYKDIRKKRLDAKKAASEARKEGTAKAVNASGIQQKNVRGSTSFGGTGKDEKARRRTVPSGAIGISQRGRDQAAINRGVAAAKKTGIPSNTAVQGGAMSQAARDQAAINRGIKAAEATGIATKPVAGSFGISAAGKAQAAKNRAEAKAKATKVKSERARAQAAAAKAKAEGKSPAQQAAAARKAAGPNRAMGFGQKTRAQAGPSARTAAGNRARVKANARKRAQAAAKKRKAAKKSAPKKRAPRKTRTRRGTRRGRRRGRRRCDIMLKFDISLLTNNNLRHDELAEVAYFVRALRELD